MCVCEGKKEKIKSDLLTGNILKTGNLFVLNPLLTENIGTGIENVRNTNANTAISTVTLQKKPNVHRRIHTHTHDIYIIYIR